MVEDTDVTIDEIRSRFGDRIARLVESESDRFEDGMDWRSRKEDSLRRLKEASREEKIVALGDKLSNMRAIARDYSEMGEPFWNLFHIKEKAAHSWRYHALVDAFSDLSGTYAFDEFRYLVNLVFPLQS